jgi:transcriptional regulator with XRE-family HTH domain
MSNFTEDYTHSGVKRVIIRILKYQAISQYELAKRAQLNPSTIYQILSKDEEDTSRPPRLSTVTAIARATGHSVTFDNEHNRLSFEKVAEPPARDDVEELIADIRTILQRSARERFSKEEKERILDVLKALV